MSVRGWVMSFYIPKMPSKKLSILRDIKLLKELEVSKDDIIKAKKYKMVLAQKSVNFMFWVKLAFLAVKKG